MFIFLYIPAHQEHIKRFCLWLLLVRKKLYPVLAHGEIGYTEKVYITHIVRNGRKYNWKLDLPCALFFSFRIALIFHTLLSLPLTKMSAYLQRQKSCALFLAWAPKKSTRMLKRAPKKSI